MNKNLKKVLIIGLIIITILFGYKSFFGGKDDSLVKKDTNGLIPENPLQTSQTNQTNNQTDSFLKVENLLGLLLSINNINLSDSFFKKAEFLALKDLTLQNEFENLDLRYGRKNPFLPIGDESNGEYNNSENSNSQVESFVKTLSATKITKTSAELNAENLIKSNTKEQYFVWGVTEEALDQKTLNIGLTGEFTSVLNSLLSDKTYYYQSIIKTKDDKIILGDIKSFNTLK
jgi:hypothetical protein